MPAISVVGIFAAKILLIALSIIVNVLLGVSLIIQHQVDPRYIGRGRRKIVVRPVGTLIEEVKTPAVRFFEKQVGSFFLEEYYIGHPTIMSRQCKHFHLRLEQDTEQHRISIQWVKRCWRATAHIEKIGSSRQRQPADHLCRSVLFYICSEK